MAAEPCSTATTRDLEQLEKHLAVLIRAARDEQDLYNKLTQASLDKYEGQITIRFHEVNNLREQLAKDYVRREAYEALADRLARVAETTENRIGGMEKTLAGIEGSKWAFGVVLTLITLAISVGGVFWRHT